MDVLIVEDTPADAQLLQIALQQSSLPIHFQVFNRADKALAYLKEADALPDILLIDVHLPGMSGIELCEKIRENPDWQRLPLCLLVSSESDRDYLLERPLPHQGVLVKPEETAQFASFTEQFQSILS